MNKISISLFFLFTILVYYGQEKLTNKKVVALGGISKKNINKISLLNISSIAGISYFD